MTTVRILLSNPATLHAETASTDWFISGTRPERVERFLDENQSFRSIVNRVSSLPGEYSLIAVSSNPIKLHAYRGITSSFDVFFCENLADETIVVGDHFRDVLSQLSVSERSIPDSVPADHLLFGTRPRETYVEEVNRLGHGELLNWKIGKEPDVELAETLTVEDSLSTSQAISRLDQYFSKLLNESNFERSVTTMLSGGVDSTLIHSYLDTDTTVSAAFDSPEFEFEVEYATEASRLLGSNHQLVKLDEEEFCEQVERTTDATGQPLQHPQATLMHAAVSQTPHQTYLNGQLADGIFGTGNAMKAHIARYIGPTARILPTAPPIVSKLKTVYEQLRLQSTHPDGLAMNFVIHGDEKRVAEIFGDDVIRDRKHGRLQYTRRRVSVSEGTGYADHSHLGHLIDFFQDNTVTPWRHAAHASGKSMHTPFAGQKVVKTVLAVPPSKRYARFARPPQNDPKRIIKRKHLLKDLLEERVPEYNTRKRKGSSALPIQRYFEDGPLSGAFSRYSIPEFIPEEKRDLIRQGGDHIAWYTFSYAVWRDRILKNDELDIFSSSSEIEF